MLGDLAAHSDRTTARVTAQSIEYPAEQLELAGMGWPWRPTALFALTITAAIGVALLPAEPAGPDHPGHHRAGVDADANGQRPAARVRAAGHLPQHRQGHLGHRLGVVGAGLGQPADHGDREPQQVGERVGAPARLERDADRGQDRGRDHQGEAQIEERPGNALHPLQRLHAHRPEEHAGHLPDVVLAMSLSNGSSRTPK
jgi:hypothetical protein